MASYTKYWFKGLSLPIVPQLISTSSPRYWFKGLPFAPLLEPVTPTPPPGSGANALPRAMRLVMQEANKTPYSYYVVKRRFAPPAEQAVTIYPFLFTVT